VDPWDLIAGSGAFRETGFDSPTEQMFRIAVDLAMAEAARRRNDSMTIMQGAYDFSNSGNAGPQPYRAVGTGALPPLYLPPGFGGDAPYGLNVTRGAGGSNSGVYMAPIPGGPIMWDVSPNRPPTPLGPGGPRPGGYQSVRDPRRRQ
jgi:hypothetical protein